MDKPLSSKEYKKILQYTLALSSSTDFYNDALNYLQILIPFDAAFFISYSNIANMEQTSTYNLNPKMLSLYINDIYEYDPILCRGSKQVISFSPETISVISVEDTPVTRDNQSFIELMKQFNYSCALILNINENGDGIRLFKNTGMFSTTDINIGKYLDTTLNTLYDNQMRLEKNKHSQKIFDVTKQNMSFGYLVFNKDFKLLESNKVAIDRIYQMTEENSMDSMIEKFVIIMKNILANPHNTSIETAGNEYYDHIKNYIVEIIKNTDISYREELDIYYVCFIFDKNWFRSAIQINHKVALKHYNLTERENQIAILLLDGQSNQSIAEKLCISPYTSKDHTKNIFRKLSVNSREEFILKIFRQCN